MPPSDSSSLDFPALPAAVRRGERCTYWRDLLLLAVVGGLWFCALLGLGPLSNQDEGRYTEIPREMAATGDYVTPRLNGVKYFEKPPLVYWLSALTFRRFGVNEFTARLWNGLFALGGVLLTYATARALAGRGAGIWAAVVLATTLMYYAMSQIVLLDMAAAVTISGALFAFLLAVREPPGRRRRGLFLACYAFMALATLAKGLIGIALPGAVIFLWLLLLKRWRVLRPFHPFAGAVILLAIAAPWHVLAARANPDFLHFYFIHEHWLRFTTRIHHRYQPWWFFLPFLAGGLFPWVFFAGQAVRHSLAGGWKARRENPEAWFFLIWIMGIMAFFSISQSKLIPYILPVFPAAAVLLGRLLAGIWRGTPSSKFRPAGRAFIVTALLAAVAAVVTPGIKGQPELSAYLPVLKVTVCGSMLLGAAAAGFGLRRNRPRVLLAAMAVSCAALLLALHFGGAELRATSTKELAITLRPMLKPGDRVYNVGDYRQDLPVYLGRLVSLVDDQGELAFGIAAEPELTRARFFNHEDLPGHWAQPGTAYAVMRRTSYDNLFFKLGLAHEVIAQTQGYVLVVKRPDQSQP